MLLEPQVRQELESPEGPEWPESQEREVSPVETELPAQWDQWVLRATLDSQV